MSALSEWLGAREDGVPETLSVELSKCVVVNDAVSLSPLDALVASAAAQMESMRGRSCVAREDALALLATDALVTYLLELAASQRISDLETFAGDVLRMIAGPDTSSSTPAPHA